MAFLRCDKGGSDNSCSFFLLLLCLITWDGSVFQEHSFELPKSLQSMNNIPDNVGSLQPKVTVTVFTWCDDSPETLIGKGKSGPGF